jgi:hypothetical protein
MVTSSRRRAAQRGGRAGKAHQQLLVLIKLPEFKPASAVNVMQAFSDKLLNP